MSAAGATQALRIAAERYGALKNSYQSNNWNNENSRVKIKEL